MALKFSKMHGLGNDFVVFNAIDQEVQLTPEQCRRIADRHFGIGCDQILLIEVSREPDTDFYYRIFNADGSEVEQCGNGARCFGRYVRTQGLTGKEVIDVGTHSGRIKLYIENEDQIRIDMGAPVLEPDLIPLEADRRELLYPIDVNGKQFDIGGVSMGNPHAVLQVASVNSAPVLTLGPLLENHVCFPQRVNVGFMEICSRAHIRLRVFERGTGETLACGSGACAAVVAGRLQGLLDEQVVVSLPGGDLVIKWQGEGRSVWMTGPAAHVYEGKIEI
ncbi:MAG: diaminopimelate epimerase [Gammaproteobacteria bacterium]|nr:diaminopimelate epimerase [Gammaproteobacteria bacterium]